MGTVMSARAVIRRIEQLGGCLERQVGSHATYAAILRDAHGNAAAVVRGQVPIHTGDVPPGTLRSIQRQFEPAFGEGWLI